VINKPLIFKANIFQNSYIIIINVFVIIHVYSKLIYSNRKLSKWKKNVNYRDIWEREREREILQKFFFTNRYRFYAIPRERHVRKLYCIIIDEAARKNARPQHGIVVRSRLVRSLRHYRTITRIDAESTYENIPFIKTSRFAPFTFGRSTRAGYNRLPSQIKRGIKNTSVNLFTSFHFVIVSFLFFTVTIAASLL